MTFVTHSGIPATATITIEGPTPSTLTGGILTADSTAYPVSVTPAEDNPTQFYLSIPALPLGLHLLHLIIDGATTLYTHIQTRPTPLSPSAGPETLAATITTTTTPATLTVNLNPGPAGPQGPKGDTGDVTPAATAAAAAATASADRAAQQATEATTAATLAGEAADGAQASATAAASSATTARLAADSASTYGNQAMHFGAVAQESATQAQEAAGAAQGFAQTASTAASAAQSARDVAVQSAAVYDTHVATMATYDTPGPIKLGERTTAASGYAAHVGVDENGRLAVRRASTSVVGCVKLGTGVQVTDDAGMVGFTASGAIAVRKASTNTTTGVGCVRLAASLEDTGDVAVPTASMVSTALHGSTLDIRPVDSPSEGEWNGLLLPAEVLPTWPIRKITIPTFATAQTTPLYLAAYRFNGTTETRLGVSTAACTWEAGGSATWEFAGDIIIPAGSQLRLYLITSKSDAAASSCTVISGHVRSYYVATGSISVRYSGAWYGNRTPEIDLASAPGHSSAAATTAALGHVYLATGADDARATAVPTAAQFAALVARVAALEAASTTTTA